MNSLITRSRHPMRTTLCLTTLLFCTQVQGADNKGAETQKVSAEDAFREGVAAMSSSQFDLAVERFHRCTELKSDLKECWFNLGLAWGRKRDLKKEVSAYLQALKLDPKYTRAHFNLALAYEDLGNPPLALKHYQEAVKYDPKAQDAALNRAMLLLRLKRVDDAVKAFEAATALKESNAEAWFDLAQAKEIQADQQKEPTRSAGLKAAIETYMRCLTHDPRHHRAWYNIGVVQHRLKSGAAEIAAYRKAIALKATYTPALYNLAFALRDSGDKAAAKIAFERYLAVAGKRASEKRFVAAAQAALTRL